MVDYLLPPPVIGHIDLAFAGLSDQRGRQLGCVIDLPSIDNGTIQAVKVFNSPSESQADRWFGDAVTALEHPVCHT